MIYRIFRSISSLIFGAVIAALVLYGSKDLGTVLANATLNSGSLKIDSSSISQTIHSLLPSPSTTTSNITTSPNNTTTAEANAVTNNWAGYVASGGTYTAVTGSWTVPAVSSASPEGSADATWIGIGGMNSRDLIQIGTENVVTGGQVQSQAFYEELPAYSQEITRVDVRAGDVVKASIQQDASGEWTLTLMNTTNGESYSSTVDYDSSLSSAEWIQEAPSSLQGIMTLDDFSPLNFTDLSANENGQVLPLSQVKSEAITMVNAQQESLTSVSTLDEDGTGFTVSRTTNASSVGAQSGSARGWQRREPLYQHYGY